MSPLNDLHRSAAEQMKYCTYGFFINYLNSGQPANKHFIKEIITPHFNN